MAMRGSLIRIVSDGECHWNCICARIKHHNWVLNEVKQGGQLATGDSDNQTLQINVTNANHRLKVALKFSVVQQFPRDHSTP